MSPVSRVREHVITLEARDKGLMGMLLRYPYEVREPSEYFDLDRTFLVRAMICEA